MNTFILLKEPTDGSPPVKIFEMKIDAKYSVGEMVRIDCIERVTGQDGVRKDVINEICCTVKKIKIEVTEGATLVLYTLYGILSDGGIFLEDVRPDIIRPFSKLPNA